MENGRFGIKWTTEFFNGLFINMKHVRKKRKRLTIVELWKRTRRVWIINPRTRCKSNIKKRRREQAKNRVEIEKELL